MKKAFAFSSFILISFFSFSQDFQEENLTDNLEEIIIKGNRFDIRFSETTRDIQLITQAEIEKMPVNSINELLTFIGGLDIQQRGPFGGQADIGMDGGTFEQTLILVNGIKLVDDQTAHNMMNIPVPLEAIDHIEILRGPAARVYGINALTGAINIITKKSSSSFLVADIFSGSAFKNKEENDGSGIYGGGGINLTANYGNAQQNHLFSLQQDLYNGQRYNSAQNNSRLFYNGNYNFNSAHSLQALAGYANNKFGANGFYAAPGDKEAEEIVETSIFSISSKHKLGNLSLTPRISNRYNEDDYRYFKHDLNNGRSKHYTNALMLEMNAVLTTSFGDFGWGWESRLTNISSSNIGKHKRNNHGIYGEFKKNFGKDFILNTGTYLNYNSFFGWQIYPGMDMAYLFNDFWKISAGVGSGQRIPSFTDLYVDQAPGNVGNPDLQPENSWQYNFNIDYNKNNLLFHVGGFYRDISDFIDWIRTDENTPYAPENFGKNKTFGVNTRFQNNFDFGNHQIGYKLSYNFLKPSLKSKNNTDSKYVLQTLKHQVIAGIHYNFKSLSIQFQNRYIKRELNQGYFLADFRANYEFESFSVYADISNIFNAKYKENAAIPLPPRWFTIGIKYRFIN